MIVCSPHKAPTALAIHPLQIHSLPTLPTISHKRRAPVRARVLVLPDLFPSRNVLTLRRHSVMSLKRSYPRSLADNQQLLTPAFTAPPSRSRAHGANVVVPWHGERRW